jgi:hypothetical protein
MSFMLYYSPKPSLGVIVFLLIGLVYLTSSFYLFFKQRSEPLIRRSLIIFIVFFAFSVLAVSLFKSFPFLFKGYEKEAIAVLFAIFATSAICSPDISFFILYPICYLSDKLDNDPNESSISWLYQSLFSRSFKNSIYRALGGAFLWIWLWEVTDLLIRGR